MKVELIAYTPTASGVCCDAAAVCTASDNGYRSLQHSRHPGMSPYWSTRCLPSGSKASAG